MRKPKRFFVYIMTNGPRRHVLYIGMTGDLAHRVFEHKHKVVPGFTSRYNLTKLVYYEMFFYPDAAIAREKELKGWLRKRKIALIEGVNPQWRDLAERWYDAYKPNVGTIPARSFAPPGESGYAQDDATLKRQNPNHCRMTQL